MKYAIYQKRNKDLSAQIEKVVKACKEHSFIMDELEPDIVIVLGGDGTLLKAAHHYMNRLSTTKFVGFRCGNLGFFYDFEEKDIERVIEMIEKGDYKEDSHYLLRCDCGPDYEPIHAINEVAVENPFKTIECEIEINNEEFESYAGSGLLVCSTLGSTGLNKSLGGAIVDHGLETLQLTEIASISSNLYRSLGSSLVLPYDSLIVLKGDFDGAYLGYDHKRIKLENVKEISIGFYCDKLTIIHDKNHHSFSGIKRSFLK